MRALPQILIKGDMSTETSAPQLRPHFAPEPRRWIRPFGAPLPYCKKRHTCRLPGREPLLILTVRARIPKLDCRFRSRATAPWAGQGIGEAHLANKTSPGSFAVAAEVVRFGLRQSALQGCDSGGSLLALAPQSAGLVAVVTIIRDDLLSLFRDKSGQSGQAVQGGGPFRGRRLRWSS